ncbi:MAG: hypothetical protein QGH73_08735 [Rhodospirillales bacterium]|jgi:hypothetical protein|nr:hypothetical protein [Rhodospirillaceae bacterium]MDP6426963.1 hypothetical protein [Rhodospirillales bacterium]MDP6645335.1 hypothetical protein [Rhodospirillales bacterium]MDP6841751.1 hypothetical protein [Rhodospirillales bacterium]
MIEANVHQAKSQAFINGLKARHRSGILVAMFAATLAGLFFLEPIPQSTAYHGFADTRSWLGIPNFGDVVSNLPFAVFGGFGLFFVLGQAGRRIFDHFADRQPYIFFFIGVGLVSAGSAYYHWAPDNARLFWDRLPMTVAFMALFSAFIVDRIDQRIGVRWLLPMLVGAGIASVFYWDWSESVGRGDLRFYLLVQFYPIVALPLICWLFPKGRYTSGRHLAWLIAWYAAAKLLEVFDPQVFAILGNTVSGHSLKHLASAAAICVVVRMLSVSGAVPD